MIPVSTAWFNRLCLRCFRAAAAALGEPRLHALLQLALLPAAAFAAPAAAAVLGCDAAHARYRAVLRALSASGFLEVRAEVCFCNVTRRADVKRHHDLSNSCGCLQACTLVCLRHGATQALDGAEETWRMNACVREAAAKLAAELGLKHAAARRALLGWDLAIPHLAWPHTAHTVQLPHFCWVPDSSPATGSAHISPAG